MSALLYVACEWVYFLTKPKRSTERLLEEQNFLTRRKQKQRAFISLCSELDRFLRSTLSKQTLTGSFHTHVRASERPKTMYMFSFLSFNLIFWNVINANPYAFLFNSIKKLQLHLSNVVLLRQIDKIWSYWSFFFSSHTSSCKQRTVINLAAALKVMRRLHTEEQSTCACGEHSSVSVTICGFWRRRRFRRNSGNISTVVCFRCVMLLVK